MKDRQALHAAAQKSVQKYLARHTIACGCQVRSGRRQSMPSSSIDNCAWVSETVPSPPWAR